MVVAGQRRSKEWDFVHYIGQPRFFLGRVPHVLYWSTNAE